MLQKHCQRSYLLCPERHVVLESELSEGTAKQAIACFTILQLRKACLTPQGKDKLPDL